MMEPVSANKIKQFMEKVSLEFMPNQTAKADAGKLQISLVPTQIIKDIAEVRMYGNAKYPEGGPDNWRQVEAIRYRDALLRHLLEYIKNPDSIDEESGLYHLQHAACNLAFLCELDHERRGAS